MLCKSKGEESKADISTSFPIRLNGPVCWMRLLGTHLGLSDLLGCGDVHACREYLKGYYACVCVCVCDLLPNGSFRTHTNQPASQPANQPVS